MARATTKYTDCGKAFRWEHKPEYGTVNGYVPVLIADGSVHLLKNCPECSAIWRRKRALAPDATVTDTATPDVAGMSRVELQSLYSTRFAAAEIAAGFDGTARTVIRQKASNDLLREALLASKTIHEIHPETVAEWLGGQIIPQATAAEVDVEALRNAILAELDAEIDAKVAEAVANQSPVTFEIVRPDGTRKLTSRTHPAFSTVLKWASLPVPVLMVGPTGSGKTTLARQIGEALNLTVYIVPMGIGVDEIQLLGYNGVSGYVKGKCREAFENGGIIVLDEFDAADPTGLIAGHEIIGTKAGNTVVFPDGPVAKHPDCIVLAAANTYGRGADTEYVGRNQMDAATIKRFATVLVEYDETLEREIIRSYGAFDAWASRVQTIRKYVMENRMREIVSPRLAEFGAQALAAGQLTIEEIEEAVIFSGMEPENKRRILSACGPAPTV